MSILFDSDIIIHYIAAPGLPGDGFTAPEASAIRGDLDNLLARPVISQLTDIPDVVGTPANNDTIFWNDTTDQWEIGTPQSAIWVESVVGSTTYITANEFAKRIAVNEGLTAQAQSGFPERVLINVQYGGTGTSNSVARADHVHIVSDDKMFAIAASGTLSSGTRSLVNTSITGLDPAKNYVIKGTLYLHLRGDGTGASYVRPSVTIGPLTRNVFEDSRGVAGVIVTETVPHEGGYFTGVTSVAVSANVAFQPGDPAYIGGGVLVIEIESNR